MLRWLMLCMLALPARAETVTVAAAANFATTLEAIRTAFERHTEHRVNVVLGGTGLLATQIMRAAPFDVLLAADEIRPNMLAELGHAEPDTAFVYAIGQLVFWTPGRANTQTIARWIRATEKPLALANPKLAPYGVAAKSVIDVELQAAGTDFDSLQRAGGLVLADNVAGAFAMAASGNAIGAFVALSQCLSEGVDEAEYDVLDASSYPAIRQRAIITRRGQSNPAAHDFMAFLRSVETRALIARAGYLLPSVEGRTDD